MSFKNEFIQLIDRYYAKNRIEMQEVFTYFTILLSYRSSCAKTRQAAIIVKDGRIVSMGYCGTPKGDINCRFVENGEQICGKDSSGSCYRSVHAETNALAFANKQGISIEGASIFCTMSPCIGCARAIVAFGIKEYNYIDEYRLTEGKEYLNRYNVKVNKMEI